MAKLSVSLDDDLAEQLKEAAGDNVSAYVASAVRRQIELEQLRGFVSELELELGAVDENEVDEIVASLQGAIPPQRKSRLRR